MADKKIQTETEGDSLLSQAILDPLLSFAPWTDKQVKILNAFQANPYFHPYTCFNRNKNTHRTIEHDFGILIATKNGWICEDCDYKQQWAFVDAVALDETIYSLHIMQIENLITLDPDPASLDGKRLLLLSDVIEQYEKEKYQVINQVKQDAI